MKYDVYQVNNRFAVRTLGDLSKTMLELISKKPFEKITVNELCEISNYPRATFYNYFDDIYSLLDYCWHIITKKVNLDDYYEIEPNERVYVLAERFYDFLNEKKELVERILKYNHVDGMLLQSMHRYLQKMLLELMKDCPCNNCHDVPYELLGKHYTNTILLVMESSFIGSEKMDKKQGLAALQYLLKDL